MWTSYMEAPFVGCPQVPLAHRTVIIEGGRGRESNIKRIMKS